MGRKLVRQRAERMTQETGFMPISVRLIHGSEDAACLDRMTEICGTRSDALRAGLHALERGLSYTGMMTAAMRTRAEAAEAEVERLRAVISKAVEDLPEWSAGELKRLSPAEVLSDEVRMTLRAAVTA